MTDGDPALDTLLRYVRDARGFDFTGYKRAGLERRIRRRLTAAGLDSYGEYLDHLQANPEEFAALFTAILVNVTEFFRDAETWQVLRDQVLPELIAARRPAEPIRVWVAGCASGEEAYSIAILLAEALGHEDYRERTKIYATDVDGEALARARRASYSRTAVANVPRELRDRYFEPVGDRLVFRRELGRPVVLGRNDLVRDAVISRVHLLLCRNVLMYLNAETQARVLGRLHFALAPDGLLVLGRAETVPGQLGLFTAHDPHRRIFRPAPRAAAGAVGTRRRPAGSDVGDRLAAETVLAAPTPQAVLTPDRRLAVVSRRAEALLGLSARDVGRPFADLEVCHRPRELGPLLDRAALDRRTVRARGVPWLRGTEIVHVDIHVTPLLDTDGSLLGTAVAFQDTTAVHRLRTELEQANRGLEAAREHLRSTVGELETTTEELQSTVEELETTTEELQSTVEELEAANEQLRSANDELRATNAELRGRTGELDELAAVLDGVLGGLRAGIVVVDTDLSVRAWNRRAEDLSGLPADRAVGRHLLTLDVGFAVHELGRVVRDAMAPDAEGFDVVLPATDRRGRHPPVRAVGDPIRTPDGRFRGALITLSTS